MWSGGFDKSSGPGTGTGTGTPRQQAPSIGYRPPFQSPSSWFNGSSPKPEGHQSPAAVSVIPSNVHGTKFPAKTQVQDLKRTRSPPSFSTHKEVLQNSTSVVGRPSVSPRRLTSSNVWTPPYADVDKSASKLPLPKRTRSPFSSDIGLQGKNPVHDDVDAQRPSVFPPRGASSHVSYAADLDKPATVPGELPVPKRTRSPYSTDQGLRGNFVHDDDAERPYVSPPRLSARSKTPPYADLDKPATNPSEASVPKRIRSTDLGSWRNNSSHDDVDAKRPSVSPPRLSIRSSSPVSYADLDTPVTNTSELPLPKRTRLPFSTDLGLRGNNSVHHDDAEREVQAKAKRLARFRDELSQPEPSDAVNRNHQKPQQANFFGTTGHMRSSDLETEGGDQDSSAVIIGYCPDMCPEQERAERERKGDLDQYERFDGDRNHTTESLAVKKYTRTAEREAALIRPMKILHKTMDYLLNLLDQPYDGRFLGLYNFLWDRMRAIRMDLRMQHIFNLGAITMLEQMIRLHIIAMHELCEYTKGEGFSVGFDAHLNIEQMNKTSVELFQLYDDHRKNGIDVPTEREFRGYYALLKLDKHPGYKVEASELSLDLAKMTPGIRQAAEVLFARDVARACRSGNFIAFFRLVRKASYLQACLMHAHFGKLRTQALAALHSGLQNNQGIPVAQVSKWLGMEEENMEDLLDYHGFSIKEFEEPYMVKEGQFLNGDSEYPFKCSKLVHLKRSRTVVEDVLLPPPCLMESFSLKGVVADDDMQHEQPVAHKGKTQNFANAIDSHMADDGNDTQLQPVLSTPFVVDDSWKLEVASPSPRDIFKIKTSSPFKSPTFDSTSSTKPSYDTGFRNYLEKHGQSNIPPKNVFVETLPDVQPVERDPTQEPENVIQEVATEIETDTSVDEQVAEAKLKLILRLWRRRAFIKKDLRDQKQLAANAALSSLSLGPPMGHHKEQLKVAGDSDFDFDIDRVKCERCEKQEHLWSTINVSNVVAPTLGERYQYPKCICWKLLVSFLDLEQPGTKVPNLDLASWLRYKLLPENVNDDDDLVASFPGLSIWKKWDYGKPCACYLSVVRDIIKSSDLLEEMVLGASAVMFLVSENISWEAQKIRLHNLISAIPYPCCLPLVLLNGTYEISQSTIIANLGIDEVVKSKKICSFLVVPIAKRGIFSDENLRKALEWLASESPVPPIVHRVKTRELVMRHLQFGDRADPEQCISAVNNALDESINEISEAAKSNPASWPCPEISLLDFRFSESCLPSVGWSSASTTEALIQALENCKLPYGISWPSLSGIDVNNQKAQLDQLLVTYLMPLMGLPLARKEASALIKTCVGIKLHGSTYHLFPKWVNIIRRIFNWQLAGLSNGPFATAYILASEYSSWQWLEDESGNLILPSLDEMMQAISRPNLELQMETQKLDAEVCDEVEMVGNGDDDVVVEEEEKNCVEDERSLRRLLEQCNIVQDMIDNKLSIYF